MSNDLKRFNDKRDNIFKENNIINDIESKKHYVWLRSGGCRDIEIVEKMKAKGF